MLDNDYDLVYDFLREYYDTYNGKVSTIDEFLDLLEEYTGVENTKEFLLMHLNEYQDYDNRP